MSAIHTAFNIPTVAEALRANGFEYEALKYEYDNGNNAAEIATCVRSMFNSQLTSGYNTLAGLWLIAATITISVGLIAQIAR